MSKILLNDVGFRNWGWVVLELPSERIVAHGTIVTGKADKKQKLRVSDDDARCTQHLLKETLKIIKEHSICGLLFEMPHAGARGSRPIVGMARSSAVACSLEVVTELPAEYLTPDDIKRVAKDKGAVTKEEVQKAVFKHFTGFNIDEFDEHQADALAVYLAAKDGLMVKMLKR